MKYLIVLFALIAAAYAAPQFFPLGGGFSGSQSAAQAQSASFGAGFGSGNGFSGSQSAASAQSASFGSGGGFGFGR